MITMHENAAEPLVIGVLLGEHVGSETHANLSRASMSDAELSVKCKENQQQQQQQQQQTTNILL